MPLISNSKRTKWRGILKLVEQLWNCEAFRPNASSSLAEQCYDPAKDSSILILTTFKRFRM